MQTVQLIILYNSTIMYVCISYSLIIYFIETEILIFYFYFLKSYKILKLVPRNQLVMYFIILIIMSILPKYILSFYGKITHFKNIKYIIYCQHIYKIILSS